MIDEVVGECADKNPECGRWAKMGECSKNKRFMLSSCSRACEVCDEKRNGCSRRNATAGCATQVPNPRLAGPRQVCYSHVRALPWTGWSRARARAHWRRCSG